MKQYILPLFLIISTAPLCSMEVDPDNNNEYQIAPIVNYPVGMGYIPEEEIFTDESVVANFIPNEQQEEARAFINANPAITQRCILTPEQAALSPMNYVRILENTVIKIAGANSTLRTNISSLGHDPYSSNTPPSVFLKASNSKNPRFQHLSILITEALIKRAKSETVVPVRTWPCHIGGKPTEASDQNYIIVQEKMGSQYKQFSKLDKQEKQTVLKNIDLAELYRVLKYANLWNPSEDNLWINSIKQTEITYPDGEKPNNEGSGIGAKWKVAIFGQDLGKAKHNIRNPWDGGHRIFENILQAHCPEKVAEWMAYYESDTDVK